MKRAIIILSLILINSNVFAQDFQKQMSIGKEYTKKALYEKAISAYKKAEKTASRKYEKNIVFQALADNYNKISDYNHAMDYYLKLNSIYNGENQKRVLLNLSDLWLLTGQYQMVIDNFRNMTDCPDEAKRLVNISSAYCRLNREDEALTFLDNILKDRNSRYYKIALHNKGYILWQIKNYHDAEKCLDRAISLYDNDDERKYICQANLAVVKSELKKHDFAKKLIQQTLDWQEKNIGKNHLDYIISLRKKAEILYAAGDKIDATIESKNFFFLIKDYICKHFAYMTENERLSFWHGQKKFIDECYTLGAHDEEFLFNVAVFSKSILTQANKNFNELAQKDKKLSAQYDSLLEMKTKMLSANLEQRRELEKNAQILEKELMNKMPGLSKFLSELNISDKYINKILEPNNVAIEFVYYNWKDTMRYAALLKFPDGMVKNVPLFTKEEIEDYPMNAGKLHTLKECINYTKPRTPLLEKSKAMIYSDTAISNLVWKNIIKEIPLNAEVYFSADGILHNLAIEYICYQRPDLKIHRLSSMRSLLEKNKQRPDLGATLLIGDINYDDATLASQNVDTIPDRSGSKILGNNWVTLKNSIKELQSAKNIFKLSFKQMLMKNAATEEVVKKMLPRYNTIIFSTHGYSKSSLEIRDINKFQDNIAIDSAMTMCGIVLSGANVLSNQDSSFQYYEDGLLTGLEFSRLDLSNVDLVVFSACETNLGALTADGAFNLPRGLKKAGVNSIIATLWEVDDKLTKEFMTMFFRQLKLGKTKYDALIAAQNHIKRLPSHNNPYFWAPFVLIDGLN